MQKIAPRAVVWELDTLYIQIEFKPVTFEAVTEGSYMSSKILFCKQCKINLNQIFKKTSAVFSGVVFRQRRHGTAEQPQQQCRHQ